jgi:transcription-repair coupling factor (superfamily II helicase)
MSALPLLPSSSSDHKKWGNLPGAGLGYAATRAILAHDGVTLVVTPDTAHAEQLRNEIDFFSGGQIEVLQFPDWETLPYDNFSPHEDIINQRLTTLSHMRHLTAGVVILPIATLLHRLPPTAFVAAHALVLAVGQQLIPEQFRAALQSSGYRNVSTVFEHGEYAIRGAVMDIFPMGSKVPVRIDLFDTEIETLRTFDPDTQRSLTALTQLEILPAREFILSEPSIAGFRARFREQFDLPTKDSQTYQDVSNGIAPAGIEYFLPLFYDQLATMFDYLPDDALVITHADIESAGDYFWDEIQERYENRRHDIRNPILPPAQVFIKTDELFGLFKRFRRLSLSRAPLPEKVGSANLKVDPPQEYPIDSRLQNPLNALDCLILETDHRILFCAETAGRRQSLLDVFQTIRLAPETFESWQDFIQADDRFGIIVAPLEQGVNFRDPHIDVIAESQLFGVTRIAQRRRQQRNPEVADNFVKNLSELQVNAPVVHIDHGVGRYRGLETIEVEGERSEYLKLEYAGSSVLYVPVTNLHLISRYSSAQAEGVQLNRLGNDRWANAKRKAAEKIRDTAAELLEIYARRKARQGHSFAIDNDDYRKFSGGFPFEETVDQKEAIAAILRDLESPQPTDRLVCGDVGFGKTEVAMRATFVVAHAGKQVAVLVPTTLLAQQHYENFKDRFADWPIRIELLSRFRTGSESNKVLEGLEDGRVDIVIGTHKLLSKTIKFKQLGLLIIDEEHRFGVQQKEKIKSLRANVDILALTATPIPRTLNMAMASIRDLSIIATPPAKRLSVMTFVRQREDALIKEALLREILRGGQVYFLHNEVKDIDKIAADLAALVPEARVAVGHGQMGERALERVMSDFYHRKFNVLVCTTIIETGIDVPTANTIIIDRADKFGLAQLHQLRGRVGRSHHQAYAYLLTTDPKVISSDAKKRLEAITEAHSLGAGFTLATHDLEIRGAGELLGEEQSGHIETIGYTLYMELLDRAVKAMQSGVEPDLDLSLQSGSEVNLRVPALIPDDFIPDITARLTLYKRIANCKDASELTELQVEIIDRFGLLPVQTKNLFRQTQIRQDIEALGIVKVDIGPKGGTLSFAANTRVAPIQIIKLIQQQPNTYKMVRGDQVRLTIELPEVEDRFNCIEHLLKVFAPQ